MRHVSWDLWQLFDDLLDKTVSKVYVIAFVYGDEVYWDNGELEIWFENDKVIRLVSANGGDDLAVETSTWIDSYNEPYSQSEIDDIKTYGKLTKFDVSLKEPYRKIIGVNLVAVYPLVSQFKLLAGVRLVFNDEIVNFLVDADERHILWGRASKDLMSFGYYILESNHLK